MRILLDTHILIWHLEGNVKLSSERRRLITDSANTALVSVASLWEIAIKSSLNKLSLSTSIEEIVGAVERSSGSLLSIEAIHTLQVAKLPFHHKDPFDRMIIAQALCEGLSVMTLDPAFSKYSVPLL